MVAATRNNAGGTGEDAGIEAIRASIEELTHAVTQVNGRINRVIMQQQYLSDDVQRIRNGEGMNPRGHVQLTRLTKLEFPKFEGDDVRGWIYKCKQFFEVDKVEETEKVRIASIHMYKRALSWHQQFVRINGEEVDWTVYEEAVLKRFGTTVEDPLSELKNLRQIGSVDAYFDEFERLLNKIEVSEKHAISLFLAGLMKEIELSVRMFKPRTLEDAYCLAKLQEDTIAVSKRRSTPLLSTPRSTFIAKNNTYTPAMTNTVSQPTANNQLALPITPYNAATKNGSKRLTQKEIEEKRAKHLCFYCDEKYSTSHKCSGQLYTLEVVGSEVIEEIKCVDVNENDGEVGTGANTYQTMRVTGSVNKYKVHILIDSGSTHNFLDYETAKRLGCKLSTTAPMQVIVPGGSKLLTTSGCDKVVWVINGATFSSDMVLIPLGGSEMVLGIQWLKTLGDIKWNFDELTMSFKYKGSKVELRGTRKSKLQWMEAKRIPNEAQCAQAQLSSMILCVYPVTIYHMNQAVAVKELPLPSVIEEVLVNYEDVFAMPTKLPPQRKKDHRIPLKEGTQPINIRPYRHPPTQKDAIEAMVAELLESGVIRASQSPYAAPIVMVKKKMEPGGCVWIIENLTSIPSRTNFQFQSLRSL
ncbi:uncharacterized protein [Rutidosis leptorrhynchoides]|uniref:uncharacterized protein n=1 Tax=Rutidosis leptorrhynchoides TaxID=125765 RepID=UPI003A98ED67